MRVIIVDTPQDVAATGSDFFVEQVSQNPKSVLGLATGSTPLALYQELIAAYKAGRVSFAEVTTFNLDEYMGLQPDHPQSYRYYMQQSLFNHINVELSETYVPNGACDAPLKACEHYEKLIANSGGIDLQLLGIGRNGHIGFNEPSSSLSSRTRIKALTQATIDDNARFFKAGEFQPNLSLTMGIGTIMEAKRVLLIANGEGKAQAIKAMVEGPLSASCPASILQMHQNAIVIIDRQAASQLEHTEFYQFVENENRQLIAQGLA